MSPVIFADPAAEPACRLPADVPQFFFTDELVAHHERVTRTWMQAYTAPHPVLVPEKPWEGRCLTLFGTVLAHPEDGYRMYYANFINGTQDVLLATSTDGLNWTRPELGLVDWKGSKKNNLVISRYAVPERLDSPSVVHDHQDPDYPYKLIAAENRVINQDGAAMPRWCLVAYKSRDGLAWEKSDRILLVAGDRTNLMSHRVDGRFVAYTRGAEMMNRHGKRVIYRTDSSDFAAWREPECVLEPDLDDDPDVEFYGMSVFQRYGWHLGLLEYWRSAQDEMDVHLAFSRDGKNWLRPQKRTPFIAPEYHWNRKWNNCASNGPIILKDRMAFHLGARSVAHSYDAVNFDGVIGVSSIPVDRFCAIEARQEGILVTVPMLWPGGELILNADTRESYESHASYCNGWCGVALLDRDGKPLEGWSGQNQAVFQGNTHARNQVSSGLVRWSDGRKMDTLKNQLIRIRFTLRHARLFTIQAGYGT